MQYIVTHYASIDGDFSPTTLECFDTYEGYKYVAKRFNLGEPDAIPLAADLTAIFSFFINSDTYSEWKIVRAVTRKEGSYDKGHYEKQMVDMEDELGNITTEEQDVWIVDEVVPILSLTLTYQREILEGSIKKEKITSDKLPQIEQNLVSIWNTLSADVETIKNTKKAEEEEKRRLIDGRN